MLCEQLGCAPSELLEKHPNITRNDITFMIKYNHMKLQKQAGMTAQIIAKMFSKR